MNYRFFSTLLLITFIGVASSLMPMKAVAHEFEPERQLLVQVFPEHIDIVLFYTEAPGPRSDLFLTQFGLRHDTSGPLAHLASRAILPRVLDGLQFEVPHTTPRTGTPEVQLKNEQDRLMVATFVRYNLDPLDEGEERTFIVRSVDRSFLPTRVRIYAGEGMQRSSDGSDSQAVMLERDGASQATFSLR